VDWSPDGTKLAFDRRDDDGNYQLFTISPSGTGETCITFPAVTGGPTSTRHKGFPAWHPNSEYIVCQVEMETHNGARSLSEPGRGHQCNVWVCKADGSEWWQLTTYSGETVSGVLNPRFSHDGTKLLWASKTAGVSAPAPFGEWELQLADFAFVDGVPTVSNITTLTPAGLFYEAHGFSRDDSKILFTSDVALNSPYGLDVFMYTLPSGPLVNLTNSAQEWDEHAHYAPHADVIAFMSSRGTTFDADAIDVANLTDLQSEAVIMKADGTQRRVLTHFNTANFPEYTAENSVSTVISFSPSGRQAVVAQLLLGANYDTVAGRRLWMITFNGVYSA